MHDDGTPHTHPHPTSPSESRDPKTSDSASDRDANPPRTTKDGITAPKFGSAGSGGAELEPGPKKN